MRRLKTGLTSLILLVLTGAIGFAQEESNTQAFWVHEDVVKPSKVVDYESICKELTDNMKKHNIQEISTIVTNTEDDRYLWVSPIANMAAIDKPIFTTLREKMGKETFSNMFNRMDECYDVEQDYVIHLDKSLSYMPEGITQTPEGEDYRKFFYFHITPSNRAMVKKTMEAITNLFSSKGSKFYYRVYKSGFGTRGEFYMVAAAAKNPTDYSEKVAANNELLGDEWPKLYGELRSHLLKYEVFSGRMRPDMAYSPSE
jgi:Fe-S cluster assembly scaffold protein SufB